MLAIRNGKLVCKHTQMGHKMVFILIVSKKRSHLSRFNGLDTLHEIICFGKS